MIGAMWKGMSGIYQQDRGIAVESNNLANSSTVGHKKDQITFADLLYTNGGMGHGVGSQSVSKQFQQGQIVGTGVGIDVALEGKGFMVVRSRENPDEIFYTRAGNLVQAKDGFLVNQDDYKMQGLVPQSRLTSSTNPADTMFTDEFARNIVSTNISNSLGRIFNINAKTTDYASSAKNDDIAQKGDNYKSSQSKINDVDALREDYINKLKEYQLTPNVPEISSQAQKSQVDFSSKISSLTSEDNKLSITVGNKTFSVEFDHDGNINQDEMEKLYNFLDDSGREKYGLIDPSSIPTQDDIDNMPITTPEEIQAKADRQSLRDNSINAYSSAKSLVKAMQDLSDKISAYAGYSSSAKSGTLEIEGLIQGKEFKISEVELNNEKINSTNIQEAIKGSGMAMIDSAKEALKQAVEKADAKYLEITNVLDYADLNTIGMTDLNVRLDVLGLADKDVADVEISDDGFIFVKSGDNKFLVGRLSTASFRNEQGLNPAGGNLYSQTDLSGNPFNADTMNTIKGKSLERANVDYGTTLTQIMVYQKAFEANSKSITTSDEFLQTAIGLIK
ncbi:flagellar hook-basal body complex protein [Aliarcobacter vitoriensis]|uniref:Flagellar biosynthesis protein FlgE n=1 Tax=Aliarcobacter vitoriensis TaxID=2011099 RepID=A0A366MW90_9BACT|nr:flagellar hook-basal body complex protein [Aliarcobacter vitoriensis]RBQ29749.1 flagellar biosynthesis protein FlgE [Aliarcobacter vitoriensis]